MSNSKIAKPSSSTTGQRCRVLWTSKSEADKEASSKLLTDDTWAYCFRKETIGMVAINVKAGNKDLVLGGYSENQKLKLSEALLRRRYR